MSAKQTSKKRVIVVGGGIAGLTVAHELVERDFEVDVYERRPRLGGKAASVDVENLKSSIGSAPGEHGFHFFPGWYRHLRDTLERIPVRRHHDGTGERWVSERLVPTPSNLLVRYEGEPIPIVLHSPTTMTQAQTLFAFVRQLFTIGLPMADVIFFFQQLARFLRTPEAQREKEFDAISWWDFLEAGDRSEALRMLTVATTRTLVAAKAEEASAYTIALLAVRTLFDAPARQDGVMNAPMNDAWFDPWKRYLEEDKGVRFHFDRELEAVGFDGRAPKIASLTLARASALMETRKLRQVLHEEDAAAANESLKEWFSSHKEDFPLAVHTRDAKEESVYDPANVHHAHQVAADLIARLPLAIEEACADYYVFAIPVEQMAYYANRSKTMTSYDRPLRDDVVKLSASVDWMVGIQFYFQDLLELAPGHVVCADSEWALTAVEQTQFWKEISIPKGVRSILSVDVSAWDKKGRFHRKEAFQCTKQEIAEEVWAQLEASFNHGRKDLLRKRSLVTGDLAGSFHIDDDLVERFDRKKQAAFASGIDRAIGRFAETSASSDELLEAASVDNEAPFAFGDRLEVNAEPLLVNRPGNLASRPTPKRAIDNMFLAADYVRTSTNLACMEGANEAARLAVNEILQNAQSKHKPCRLWRLEDGELLARMAALLTFAEKLPGAAVSMEAATAAANNLTSWVTQKSQNFRNRWSKR